MAATTTKHTPGPWHVEDDREIWAGGNNVADAWVGLAGADLDTADANARLIAAAPDLLEALRPFALIGIGTNPDYQPMIRMDRDAILAARAAVAKATAAA